MGAVYPRVGGGNGRDERPYRRRAGLSPRGRGKLATSAPPATYGGSIPAWAGETTGPANYQLLQEVYPRVGGGNGESIVKGSLPNGLSPRGRGKHKACFNPNHLRRSIPAWAGETHILPLAQYPAAVYPRVGGGNYQHAVAIGVHNGLSPRGRGKLVGRCG